MTAALEDIKVIDIEEWLTLATAPSPTKLKQGQTPNAKNVWVDEKPGSVITAPGLIKVGAIPSGNPVSFCINYFKTSSGTQTFVVSDNATVWTTVDFQNFTSIITGLSSSFQLRGKVIRDKLWLTNGSDSVRTFDGTTVVVLDGSAGSPTVPKGRYIDYHDERVWLYHLPSARSETQFSALTDSAGTIIAPDTANAWPASNTLQISEGDADFGTGIILYRGYLHFFKQYSIWRLVGYDEYTYTRVKTRASTGTRFNESVQILDSLVHLIGVDGIYIFDGEETERISDIIDPATASQTAFGFNQLQQPNTNNKFWEVTSSADWNAGTVPSNASINNQLAFVAADDSEADFEAGVTQTNIDSATDPGSIKLDVGDQSSSFIITSGLTGVLPGANSGRPLTIIVGSASYLTDQNTVNACGYTGTNPTGGGSEAIFEVDFSSVKVINQIKMASVALTGGVNPAINSNTQVDVDTTGSNNWVNVANGGPGAQTGPYGPTDITIAFTKVTAYKVRVRISFSGTPSLTMNEIYVYNAGYVPTGKFTSKLLDYGTAPASFGNFNADYDDNGEAITFFTQSSVDGSSWDSEVSCTSGGAVGSTIRRYLRWGANFNSSTGINSPVIRSAYLSLLYVSAIHNTGGSIFSWGPFEADRNIAAQTVNFYYRTATTSGGIPGATWNLIVPGGIISDSVANQYIQFKIEILGGTAVNLPTVTSVTINWVVGSGTQQATLQNVASAYWRNRYWLSAAGPSATANDTILVRGKKTFGSPWQLKDFSLLSFTRFQDSLYAGSSTNGNIYQVDTGYSEAGSAIDAFFETGDFTFGGFYINPIEIMIQVERKGSYNLTVGVSPDGGLTWTDYNVDLSLVAGKRTSIYKRLNIATITTDQIRFRLRINAIDEPFEVHRFVFYYKTETARGSIV